jgi:chemotaxis protein methyltransferase CheR
LNSWIVLAMPFDAESLGLRSAALPLLRDLVHERIGLSYDDTRLDLLADRLAPLVTARRLDSFLDYFYYLKYDDTSAAEWLRVADVLSVPETYFFREVDQIRAAVDVVIPELVARSKGSPLRVWSVPCASGEEPLTIAMLLDERGWFDRAHIELCAGDASPAALERAQEGRYRHRAFRSLPECYRERYFVKDGDVWRVAPSLHRRVHLWRRLNLMVDDDVQALAASPLVFCRNVFIYFSPHSIRRVVDRLANHMPTPSYLCVAAAESLLRITNRFALEEIGGAFMYVKRAPAKGRLS